MHTASNKWRRTSAGSLPNPPTTDDPQALDRRLALNLGREGILKHRLASEIHKPFQAPPEGMSRIDDATGCESIRKEKVTKLILNLGLRDWYQERTETRISKGSRPPR